MKKPSDVRDEHGVSRKSRVIPTIFVLIIRIFAPLLILLMVLTTISSTATGESFMALEATSSKADSTESATVKATPSSITMVSIPGLSFLELQPQYLKRMPHIEALIAEGAIAAMNIRAPERGMEDTYVSIGASAPISTVSTFQAWRSDEQTELGTILQQYVRFWGADASGNELIVPDFTAMNQENNRVRSHVEIGSFGTVLRNEGIHTYAYGDLRQAPFMLMDDKGLVQYGQVGETLTKKDARRAFGITTDYDQLFSLWQDSKSKQVEQKQQDQHVIPALKTKVLVLELGNLQRLYEEQRSYERNIFEQVKIEVLQEIDEFIGKLTQDLHPTDQVWMFSPLVNTEAWSSKWMFSPLLMVSQEQGSQLLYSPSTHRQGIVSMNDLAPTILGQLNIEQPLHMIGMPLEAVPASNTLSQLMRMNTEVAQVYKLRPQLLYPFVIYQITILLISLMMVLFQWSRGYRTMSLPLYTIIISPLTMLLMGWLVQLGWSTRALVIFFIFFLIIMAWIATRFPVYVSLITICAVTVIVLFIDGFTGVHAMSSSVLGYDPMIGARYYGVGNEYMGVWIGAATLGVAGCIHYWRRVQRMRMAFIVSTLLFLGILIYMASPSLGTNAGGAITAGATFGMAWLRLFSKRRQLQIHWGKLLLWIFIFACLALIGLWLLNGGSDTSNKEVSHIGRAMDQLLTGHFETIWGIIWRKLMMNVHLIGVSVWSKALLASLLVMAVLLMKPADLFRRWQEAHSSLMHGLSAIAAGAIVTLLVNDSGIVAAATMMVFVAIPMLLIRLQELRSTDCDSESASNIAPSFASSSDYSDNASHSE